MSYNDLCFGHPQFIVYFINGGFNRTPTLSNNESLYLYVQPRNHKLLLVAAQSDRVRWIWLFFSGCFPIAGYAVYCVCLRLLFAFYLGIHHHFSPSFGERFWYCLPTTKQISKSKLSQHDLPSLPSFSWNPRHLNTSKHESMTFGPSKTYQRTELQQVNRLKPFGGPPSELRNPKPRRTRMPNWNKLSKRSPRRGPATRWNGGPGWKRVGTERPIHFFWDAAL